MTETQSPETHRTGIVHLLIGTAICAGMMLLFFAFRESLPAQVPLQFRLDGTAGNRVPRDLFVFGLPLVFAIVNLLVSRRFLHDERVVPVTTRSTLPSDLKFYFVPAAIVALSILVLVLNLIW